MPFRRPATLRATLATWSALVVLVALLASSAVAYVSLRQVLWRELDERLHHDIETLEGLLQPFWTPDGPQLPAGARVLDDDDERWMEVWSPDGERLFQSDAAIAGPVPDLASPPTERAFSLDVEARGSLRVKEEAGHIAGHPVAVRVLTSEAPLHDEISEFLWLVGLAMPLIGGLAALGGYGLVRRTLRPVDALVAGASTITADRLDARLPVSDAQDEVGLIARAFNATLANLERSFEQLRRFTVNASHELRTPLTALRTRGQASLAGAPGPDECREAISDMLEDAEQLSRLLDAMLLLAQADARAIAVERRAVDLAALVQAVAEDCDILAQEKDQRLVVVADRTQAWVDPTILRIAVANLVHNAIRYGPPASDVRIAITADTTWMSIEVSDEGPGIAVEHHEHLFDRFYRVDPSRSRSLGGAGLGLAMARWSVELHGGRLTLRSQEGMGSTFRIELPRATS
jgi:heavy metal sensor kinase